MTKLLLLALGFSSASFAFAADVQITSFKFLVSGSHFSPAAELCGVLVAPTGKFEMVKILSDPNSKGPAPYYAWTGKDGKFCHIIATYSGSAEAGLAQ